LLPFDRERVSRALPDDLAFPLGDRHQHVRHELPLGRREVESEVERRDVPAALDLWVPKTRSSCSRVVGG
jgi:hypothetical protein